MANKGRLWQVDDRGYLINDARLELIKPPYQAIVDDVIEAYRQYIGDEIHSIYITGSIPRGLAVEGVSDLNAIAVLEYYTEPELVMQDWVVPTEEKILEKYGCISDIHLDIWTHGWLLYDESEFSVSAFILKTHAVCVWGIDMAPDLTAYKFTDSKTRIAIANDDIVQLEPDMDEAIESIEENNSPANVRYWCKRICKNMIHSAFGLVMVDEVVHTRDIDISMHYILKHFPQQKPDFVHIVDLITSPTDDADELLDLLEGSGNWLMTQCDAWLDIYNPDRYLEYQFERDEEE